MKGKIAALMQGRKAKIILGFLTVLLIVPFISFASDSRKIYVDDDAKGKQTGSSRHPYKTITEALKHANKNTQITVKKGHYKENIILPDDVEIFGDGEDKVTIEAEDNGKPTVTMNHKTKLGKLTVKEGRNGIRVNKNGTSLIYKVTIDDSKRDGVFVESGNDWNKDKVSIVESTIKDCGQSGIYATDRKLVVLNSEIKNNDKDGIDLDSGSFAWIKDNKIKQNGGSGIKMELDGAEVYVKKTSLEDNGREGIEIEARWKNGKIVVEKSKFKDNRNFAITRLQRSNGTQDIWKSLSIESSNEYISNKQGNISPIISIL